MVSNLLVKDLLNDLEREENIKKRIQEYLMKPIDRPTIRDQRDFGGISSSMMMSTAMAVSLRGRE